MSYSVSYVYDLVDRYSAKIKKITASTKKFQTQIRKTGRSLKRFADKTKKLGRFMSTRITLPIIAVGTFAIRAATSFQRSMNMVRAVTKSTGQEFNKLKKLAKHLGATTEFSASQAAEGMKFLGMAGLSVNEIIGALPKTLELAAAAQIDLGAAADIVTNIMSGYRLETKDLARVNDILVNAFTSSNTDLQQLGEGMKVVGPVAKGLGFRFTETAAALGVLAKNAFQGTLGGTGLRRIMTNIMSSTPKATKMFKNFGIEVKNSDGGLKSITGVLVEFEKAQKRGVTQIQLSQLALEAFGQRGGPQFLALLGAGSKALEKFENNLEEVGSSQRIAKAQMEGLPGGFKLLTSAYESLNLAITDSGFGKVVEDASRSLAEFLRKLAKTDPKFLTFLTVLVVSLAAVGVGLLGLSVIISIVGSAIAVFGVITWAAFLPILIIGAKVILIIAAIAGLIYLFMNFGKVVDYVKKKFIELWNWCKPLVILLGFLFAPIVAPVLALVVAIKFLIWAYKKLASIRKKMAETKAMTAEEADFVMSDEVYSKKDINHAHTVQSKPVTVNGQINVGVNGGKVESSSLDTDTGGNLGFNNPAYSH